jgi:hypothetical protein
MNSVLILFGFLLLLLLYSILNSLVLLATTELLTRKSNPTNRLPKPPPNTPSNI